MEPECKTWEDCREYKDANFSWNFLEDIHQNNLIISAASLNIILTSIVVSSLNNKTNEWTDK